MKAINLFLTMLVLTLGSSVASANLLNNPGFESPISYDFADTTIWQGFSADSGVNSFVFNSMAFPNSGGQSLEFGIAGVPNLFAGVLQDVGGLSAGQQVTFSGFAASGLDDGGIEIRIEWRDGIADTEVARTGNLVPSLGPAYEMFSLTDFVPVGADTARVVFAIQSFSGALNQSVFFDDASLTVAMAASEPTVLSLFGLTALILVGLRRRVRKAN